MGLDRVLRVHGLHWRAQESVDLWGKSRRLKEAIWSKSGGWWCGQVDDLAALALAAGADPAAVQAIKNRRLY